MDSKFLKKRFRRGSRKRVFYRLEKDLNIDSTEFLTT